MDVITQLETIVPAVKDIAGQVTPEQFGNATPCAKFEVRDLFDHMIGVAPEFARQLRGQTLGTPVDTASLSDEERPAALNAALDDLLAAIKSPGALGRTVQLPFGAVPGDVLARFLTVDAMVHSWDIATATGRTYDPPEPIAAAVLATARDLIAPEMRDGDTFAAETTVRDNAPTVERLAAFTGRTTHIKGDPT